MNCGNDVDKWARALAEADLAYSLGEVGVMAMSPEQFGELFEPYFAGERARERYRHLAETVVRVLNDRPTDIPGSDPD